MSWAERLEKKISGKALGAEVSKVSKAPDSPFRHFRHFGVGGISKNNSASPLRHVYRFRLHDNEGSGTFLTDEPNLDKARDGLVVKYGDRLAVVVKVNT